MQGFPFCACAQHPNLAGEDVLNAKDPPEISLGFVTSSRLCCPPTTAHGQSTFCFVDRSCSGLQAKT